MFSSIPRSLQPFISKDFVLHSRIHPLNDNRGMDYFHIKRDDELSSGITGTKYRKYASLIPFLLKNKFDEVIIIGSAQSNNVVAALQLLNENQIKARPFLLESNETELKGNLLWMNLLHDMNDVTRINRKDWKNVDEIAKKYQKEQNQSDKNIFIIPEGGLTIEAIPGVITLAYDIAENEKEKGLVFDHICIDSGSGTQAIGLLLGMRMLKMKANVHITLIAGTEDEFMDKYAAMASLFEDYTEIKIPSETWFNIHFYKPIVSPSFGSITTTVLNELKSIARNEGILMDPVYSVKHFMTAKQYILDKSLTGNILFVYSGGSFGLSGFQGMLGKSS